jgi:hypothetical protein
VLISCWSPKGGSGTSVVAASIALLSARLDDTTLVDLTGDQPAVLGMPEPASPGVAGWLDSGDDVGPAALERLAVPAAERLRLLGRGSGRLSSRRAGALAGALASSAGTCVVDAGPARAEVARAVTEAAAVSLLVIRSCYLAVRRVVATPLRPTGVVLVTEPWRALTAKDVEQVLGIPVLAEVPVDPAVARAVDAGLLASRLPRVLERQLRRAA